MKESSTAPFETLCLFNPLASRVRPKRLKKILDQSPAWGEVSYLPVTEPGWPDRVTSGTRLLVYGGDGTIHHVLQSLIGRDGELYFLPGGTANDFCHMIGLSNDLKKSLRLLENAKKVHFDTISAGGRHVLTGGGFGLGQQVARSANRLKKSLFGRILRFFTRGKIYSLLIFWHALIDRPAKLGLRKEGGGESDSRAIIFTNQKKLGKDVLLAPETKNDDGLFHLVVFDHDSSPGVLGAVLRIKVGYGREDLKLRRRETERITLKFRSPVSAFGDGEEIPPAVEWEICCHHQALSVMVPVSYTGSSKSIDLSKVAKAN